MYEVHVRSPKIAQVRREKKRRRGRGKKSFHVMNVFQRVLAPLCPAPPPLLCCQGEEKHAIEALSEERAAVQTVNGGVGRLFSGTGGGKTDDRTDKNNGGGGGGLR